MTAKEAKKVKIGDRLRCIPGLNKNLMYSNENYTGAGYIENLEFEVQNITYTDSGSRFGNKRKVVFFSETTHKRCGVFNFAVEKINKIDTELLYKLY